MAASTSFFSKKIKLLYLLQISEYDIAFFERWIKENPNLEKWWTSPTKQSLVWTLKAFTIFVLAIVFSPLVTFSERKKKLIIPYQLAVLSVRPLQGFFESIFIWRAKRKLHLNPKLIKIGIVGSYGKTTTKEYLSAVLSQRFNVFKTPENVNTLVGVARHIIKRLVKEHNIFIAEMGAYHWGDISAFRRLGELNFGILTGIGEAHMERFSSMQNIIRAKFELVKDTPGYSITPILNSDDSYIRDSFLDFIKPERVTWYGIHNHASRIFDARSIQVLPDRIRFDVWKDNTLYLQIEVPVLGRHQVAPILASVTLGHLLGMTQEEIKQGLLQIRALPRRLYLTQSSAGISIIDDTYNISLASLKAALEFIGEGYPNSRKILVSAGLLEQGQQVKETNTKAGEMMGKVTDLILIPHTSTIDYIADGLRRSGREVTWYNPTQKTRYQGGVIFESADLLDEQLEHILRSGDVVIFFPYDLPDRYY